MPWQELIKMKGLNANSENYKLRSDAASDVVEFGTVTAITHDDNNVGLPNGSWVNNANRTFEGFAPTDIGNTASMKKIIAGGFEVHNDGPEQFRSGNVCVYNAPQSVSDTVHRITPDQINYGFGTIGRARMPPAEPADAARYPESRNFTAAQGCYVPFRLNMAKGSEFAPMKMVLPAIIREDDTSATSVAGMMTLGLQNGASDAGMIFPDRVTSGAGGFHDANLHTSGAYFSGLSPETVLTLDTLFIVEVAPTAANIGMLSMTSPTAKYDPKAIEAYCNIMSRLPPGVPVAFNSKGTWFRNAAKVARDYGYAGEQIARVVGRPGAAAVIGTAANVANIMSKKTPKQRKKAAQAKGAFRLGAHNDLRV
jgi:hypothetical protein